jgi:hypothetical protein
LVFFVAIIFSEELRMLHSHIFIRALAHEPALVEYNDSVSMWKHTFYIVSANEHHMVTKSLTVMGSNNDRDASLPEVAIIAEQAGDDEPKGFAVEPAHNVIEDHDRESGVYCTRESLAGENIS